jgi:hypothetical protein
VVVDNAMNADVFLQIVAYAGCDSAATCQAAGVKPTPLIPEQVEMFGWFRDTYVDYNDDVIHDDDEDDYPVDIIDDEDLRERFSLQEQKIIMYPQLYPHHGQMMIRNHQKQKYFTYIQMEQYKTSLK